MKKEGDIGRALRRSSALIALCLTLVCAGAGAGICAAISATHPTALVLVLMFLAIFVLANRALSRLLAAGRSDPRREPPGTRTAPRARRKEPSRPKHESSHSPRPRSYP